MKLFSIFLSLFLLLILFCWFNHWFFWREMKFMNVQIFLPVFSFTFFFFKFSNVSSKVSNKFSFFFPFSTRHNTKENSCYSFFWKIKSHNFFYHFSVVTHRTVIYKFNQGINDEQQFSLFILKIFCVRCG